MNIAETLITWYLENKRDLPWRNTRDPYRIWLSEVILQQTRVNQGMQYYLRFIEKYPTVKELAAASEEEVLKLWQGLGYYSRARNLHHAAKTVSEDYGEKFPGSYSALKKLKGIGEYTAAAIASISFNETVAVVDGNVARVLSRLFAIEEPVNSPKGMSILKTIASGLIPGEAPATFNQAIMEFGALQCKPRNPDCQTCPLQSACMAFEKDAVGRLPVKSAKTKVQEIFMNYLVVTYPDQENEFVLLRKRSEEGIWKNLYDFPSADSANSMEEAESKGIALTDLLFSKQQPVLVSISREFTHLLSHRKIVAKFSRIVLISKPEETGEYISVPLSDLSSFPIPRLIDLYLTSYSFV